MASGWNLWVWLSGGGCGWKIIGVVSGCFPHITYVYIPTALVSALFCSSIPTSFFILYIAVTMRLAIVPYIILLQILYAVLRCNYISFFSEVWKATFLKYLYIPVRHIYNFFFFFSFFFSVSEC